MSPGMVEHYAAKISKCGQYRYWLSRTWSSGPPLVFVMLNPSTADAQVDDPTIRRCKGFARREGAGGVFVVNLYAYRATNPRFLRICADPVGPDNDVWLQRVIAGTVETGTPVVAAWGASAVPGRVRAVLRLVPGADWRCLGVTRAGAPRHPLYVKGDQSLVPFRGVLTSVQRMPEARPVKEAGE